jgi:hypothetical protein
MVDSVIWNSVSTAVTLVGAAGGREAAGLDAVGWEAAGLDAGGWAAAGREAAGLEAAGLDAAGLEAGGLEAAGLEAAVARAAAVDDEDELDEHAARTPTAITVTGMANQVPR